VLTAQRDDGRTLISRLFDARQRSDALFDLVRPDSMFDRPIPERHRIVFYVGHLEAFDWNLLHERAWGLASFQPELDRLFAFGVDPVGGGLPTDKPSDWPSLAKIADYRREVRARLDGELMPDLDVRAPPQDEATLETLLNMAIEHRLMHLETLAYMLHQLPPSKKIPQSDPQGKPPPPVVSTTVRIPAGPVSLGQSRSAGTFGWDNEFELYETYVPEFSIDQYMVTNGEFLEFAQAGGYDRRERWSDDDWSWRGERGIRHPVFWKRGEDRWSYRTMFGEVDLPLDWPVYVSLAEAKAYARWAGRSLPTEAQWHRAAYGAPGEERRLHPWGKDAPDASLGNFDAHRWNPAPVNAYPKGRSAFGVEGLLGNGWEWTATTFAAHPGFRAYMPHYPGYSADFFDGRHRVMLGASWATDARLARRSFRNWFQTHYPYPFTKFRCVGEPHERRAV
jgi:iron(II)-dependent oxidoreductase